MRALAFDSALHFDANYPTPQATPEYLRVKVLKAGICNTDLELIKGYMGFSGVLGHEFVGVVDTPGEWQDKRVAGEINLAMGDCEFCDHGIPSHCVHRTTLGIDRHDGAFADYVLVPPENLHLVPENVTDDQAVFVEPLAAGLQTLDKTHISPHDRVILLGAGKLGLLTAQVIALTGCDLTVICRHEKQAALLRQWQIDTAQSDDIEANSADIVVDCTGSESGFSDALELVKATGVIHLKSTYADLPKANLTRLVVDEIRVETSRCGPFPAALRLLQRGLVDVDSLIEARYPIRDAVSAMDHAAQKGALKVMLEMDA